MPNLDMGHAQPGMGHAQPGMGHAQPGMGHAQPGMGHAQPGHGTCLTCTWDMPNLDLGVAAGPICRVF